MNANRAKNALPFLWYTLIVMFSRSTFSRIARVTIVAASLVLLASRSLASVRNSPADAGTITAAALEIVFSQIQQKRG